MHDLEKVLFNFSNHSSSVQENFVHRIGFNFAISPKIVNYVDSLLAFELLYRYIGDLDIPGTDGKFIQNRLRYCAFTSYRNAGKINDKNLSKEEHTALNDLIKNNDLL